MVEEEPPSSEALTPQPTTTSTSIDFESNPPLIPPQCEDDDANLRRDESEAKELDPSSEEEEGEQEEKSAAAAAADDDEEKPQVVEQSVDVDEAVNQTVEMKEESNKEEEEVPLSLQEAALVDNEGKVPPLEVFDEVMEETIIIPQVTFDFNHDKHQLIPQCEEEEEAEDGNGQSIQLMDESEAKEPDRSNDGSLIPIPPGQSAEDEEEEEEEEEKVAMEDDLNEERPNSADGNGKAEEKISDFDGTHLNEQLNEELPQSTENGEKISSSQQVSAENALVEKDEIVPPSEKGLVAKEEQVHVFDEAMQENIEGAISDNDGAHLTEQLNSELLQSTQQDEKISPLREESVEKDEKLSSLQGESAEKGNEKEAKEEDPLLDEAMQENVEEKLSGFDETHPNEQLNEELPHLTEKDEKISPLPEESAEKDDKVSSSQEESAEKDIEESSEKEEAEEMDVDEGGPAMAAGRRSASKRKRGRPQAVQSRKLRARTKPKEDESLCFICFDGGDLVVCDHRDCPKVYHPSCVNRDEAYFKAKGQWICGWHICSSCQKSAQYMCYTCTYSLCKGCMKEADFVCVRGNKGFCQTCMKTVMLIETNKHADEAMDAVDFDDKFSWMYLFKDYWVELNARLSLTMDELTRARNPLKGKNAASRYEESLEPVDSPGNVPDDQGVSSSGYSRLHKESTSRKKVKKRLRKMTNKEGSLKEARGECLSTPEDTDWASKELLEFVAHMKNGDRSIISQFDVQGLLLKYIKQNKLRDPRRESQIVCDSRLLGLFGKSRVGHLEMLKLLEPHFLIQEASPLATDDNQGGVEDPDPSQVDADGNSDASTKLTLDKRRKSRRRIEEKGLTYLDDYAAIDVHNVSLLHLSRNLMEEFLDDTDMFHENVVGSFVRIRISGSASNKDMYRLVQVVGTGKAAGIYKTGKKATDITLEILNLNKREFITIDLISNQDFTEEECKRLRQSVKCGFIDRLTVADVQEKAKNLHAVRVNDWLESEKLRLGNLRDRASEKGRRKEHRECVEKLQLLSMPEEHIRRLNEVPEIHIDPNMDPDYGSSEDEEDIEAKKQDNYKMPRSSFGNRDEFSTGRVGSAHKTLDVACDSNRSMLQSGVQDTLLPTIPANRTDGLSKNQENYPCQLSSPKTPKADCNTQPVMVPGKSPNVLPETAPQPNTNENDKLWHYQDPAGKIQGPFSMAQLRKWNTNKFFPINLKIWRTSEKQEDSIMLTDALGGKFTNALPHYSNTSQPTNVAAMVDSRVNNFGGGVMGDNIPQAAASSPATANYNFARTIQPSSLSTTDSNACSGQSQVYNDPRSTTPFARNSSFNGRDGRGENNSRWNGGENNSRWNGGRNRENNWNSNNPRRFQHNGRGYERQHPYRNPSSQQFPANGSTNQFGSNLSNHPAQAPPQPSSIDWAGLQGAINSILPSAPNVQPTSSVPTTIPIPMQQYPATLISPAMNSVGVLASNSLPNVYPANIQQQNKPFEPVALVSSNTTPNSNRASADVLISECNQPAGSQLNETSAARDTACENKKVPVDCKELASGPVASNAQGASNLPDASVLPQMSEALSSKSHSGPHCQTPVLAPQQGTDNANVNPAQPLNTGWGMAPQNPNVGYPANMGWAYMAQGPMGMNWGTHANMNMCWGPQAQVTMNPNLGWAAPAPVNANANLAWGAQAQAQAQGNPNANWGMPMQVNSAWVQPVIRNPNPNPCWVGPTLGNSNQNVPQGPGQAMTNSSGIQNVGGGSIDSPPPPPPGRTARRNLQIP